MVQKVIFKGDSSVLHCASLRRTIFSSLARANERVLVHNVRDFPQAKLDREINASFLLNISIHVQYTRIDSSRLRLLTTRLTGSLVVSGSG